jgi:hypothetical protein
MTARSYWRLTSGNINFYELPASILAERLTLLCNYAVRALAENLDKATPTNMSTRSRMQPYPITYLRRSKIMEGACEIL